MIDGHKQAVARVNKKEEKILIFTVAHQNVAFIHSYIAIVSIYQSIERFGRRQIATAVDVDDERMNGGKNVFFEKGSEFVALAHFDRYQVTSVMMIG